LNPLFKARGEALSVTTPVAYFPEFSALVTQAAPGVDLLAAIKKRLSFFPSSETIGETERACALCGRWLKALQQITSYPNMQWSLEEMRAYNDERLTQLVERQAFGFSSADRVRVLAFFDRLAGGVADEERRVAGVHADYSPGNLLVSENRIVVIDFSMFQKGSTYHDVSHLYHHLRSLATHPRYHSRTATALCRGLLQGFAVADLSNRPLFRMFEVQHAICNLTTPILRYPMGARLLGTYLQRRRLGWLRRSCTPTNPERDRPT